MESKNPLEEIRSAILESQLFGVENEITQMGVSDELLKISDALDNYYGIKREPDDSVSDKVRILNKYVNILDSDPNISSIASDPIMEGIHIKDKFKKTTNLLGQVKEPLLSIKGKLSQKDHVYLNLSSMIVSIALRDAISSINSYRKPANYSYSRYNSITGVDNVFMTLIMESFKIFDTIKGFDMTKECRDNYEANRKSLLSVAQSISQASNPPTSASSTNRSSSSGCLVLALAVSTSIMACFSVFVLFLL